MSKTPHSSVAMAVRLREGCTAGLIDVVGKRERAEKAFDAVVLLALVLLLLALSLEALIRRLGDIGGRRPVEHHDGVLSAAARGARRHRVPEDLFQFTERFPTYEAHVLLLVQVASRAALEGPMLSGDAWLLVKQDPCHLAKGTLIGAHIGSRAERGSASAKQLRPDDRDEYPAPVG